MPKSEVDAVLDAAFPPLVKVWTYDKAPRYRAKRVLRMEHHAAPRTVWVVGRRLPLPWLNLYWPLRYWYVEPGEKPVKLAAQFSTPEAAAQFIATQPDFFPHRPAVRLDDVHYFTQRGDPAILGTLKPRKERVF
ncbi:hypothetical protein phiCbK_288 [Caulobacter phage phiCbK]|uniref:Uncharacterized protein n=5 Tax=Viruses TaxID=10239 RepID=K4JT12_9CAUD|nr:hypothetical protein D865_gp031 [Caulobacter phage phiCbK]AFO71804.1 hypothetical protein phiCbK_288 [Caulobacter phage phiCbK]AFU86863.1 hypothetical protein CbK_gp031 [Caulobacter phage phiCbK]ARB14950.1 hypothetical protein Ccr32_gp031 [Caulobacter phage Ccr32]ARB15281.1 hypothetical protein Ccr34_gp032 [Caulobacter phage Ccr34]